MPSKEFTQESAKRLLKYLIDNSSFERVNFHITDMLIYKADPEFWDSWLENISEGLAPTQAMADQMMESLKEKFEDAK